MANEKSKHFKLGILHALTHTCGNFRDQVEHVLENDRLCEDAHKTLDRAHDLLMEAYGLLNRTFELEHDEK